MKHNKLYHSITASRDKAKLMAVGIIGSVAVLAAVAGIYGICEMWRAVM